MKMDMGFRSFKKITGLLVCSCLLLSIFSTEAYSRSSGRVGNSGKDGPTCTSCHVGTLGSSITISGPKLVNADSFNDYTVTVTGPGSVGGFNLAVNDGTLIDINPVANADNVRLESGELTHESSGSKTWLTRWQAPAVPGKFILYVSGRDGTNAHVTTLEVVVPDTTPPSVSISGFPGTVNSTTPFNISAQFSESVTGFTGGDVTVTNGSATSVSGSGANYTVTITPNGGGNLSISIPSDRAFDAAANGNTASTITNVTFDNIGPTVGISGAPLTTNTTPFDVTVEFSESVTGFTSGDVTVNNGSASNVSGSGSTYTVTITPNGGGNLSISIPSDRAFDAAANGNTASTITNVTFDNIGPTVTISGAPAIVNSTATFNVTVQFSESVTGFASGDVTVSNGSATSVSGSDANYTVTITPNGEGNLSIGIGASVAQDALMNGNTASATTNVTFNVPPTASAGDNQFVDESTVVMLDGSASADSDDDGSVASYLWTQTSGVPVFLDDESSVTPSFDPPYVNSDEILEFTLVVTDNEGASTEDMVTITVTNVAVDAGVDQQVTEGDTVRLSGISSLAINGDISSHQWTQLEGPNVALDDRDNAMPSFVAPQVDATTLLVFELEVIDGGGARDYDTVFINVRDELLTSTAPPLDVQLGTQSVASDALYLFGTAGALGPDVAWNQISGPVVTLDAANTATPSFIAPTVPTDSSAVFEVRSTDLDGLVVRATVNVNILESTSSNIVPEANAGDDQEVTESNTVVLDAAIDSADPDGSILGYYWHQTSGPMVALSSIINSESTFLAPAIAAVDSPVTLTFEVLVIDNAGFVDRDSVTVTVIDNGIIGFADDVAAIVSSTGDSIGVETGSASNLIGLEAVDPTTIVDDVNRPAFLTYGLIDFSLRVVPGDTAQISFRLPEPAPDDYTWWKYSTTGGWTNYGVSFNTTRDVVTITITDNGVGDDDPVPGVIRDPGGLGIATNTNTYTVGGSISGLIGSVTLQNNAGDGLVRSADGGFTFASSLADGATYAVTVSSQPTDQVCTVSSGSGTVASANITNASVSCVTNAVSSFDEAIDTTKSVLKSVKKLEKNKSIKKHSKSKKYMKKAKKHLQNAIKFLQQRNGVKGNAQINAAIADLKKVKKKKSSVKKLINKLKGIP